jgi:protein-S-isoprenylcysteine O-methyltransferase Ste14
MLLFDSLKVDHILMNPIILRSLAFVTISAGIVAISWRSMRVIGSHGFYRFFAWEAIAALFVLNIDVWFRDPWSPAQIASWILLCTSAVVVVLGVLELRSHGKPDSRREDAALMSFEKTSVLVTTGIYGYIRHPLYASLFFLAWGILLKDISWYSFYLALGASGFLITTAKTDEIECVRYFGTAYHDYMARTKMFIPFLM